MDIDKNIAILKSQQTEVRALRELTALRASTDTHGVMFLQYLAAQEDNTEALLLLIESQLHVQAVAVGRLSFEIGLNSKWATFDKDNATLLADHFKKEIECFDTLLVSSETSDEEKKRKNEVYERMKSAWRTKGPQGSVETLMAAFFKHKGPSSNRTAHALLWRVPSALLHGNPSLLDNSDIALSGLAIDLAFHGARLTLEAVRERFSA